MLTPTILCHYLVHYLVSSTETWDRVEWKKSRVEISTWTGFEGERYFGAETTLADGARISVTVPAKKGQTEMIAIEAIKEAVSTHTDTALQLVSMEWI